MRAVTLQEQLTEAVLTMAGAVEEGTLCWAPADLLTLTDNAAGKL